jgi:transcriptional regulator GlxA family with amidase domain
VPFHAETGQSPAKAAENLRVEAARHPIDVIARQTGFADRGRLRRAFGQPPQVIRLCLAQADCSALSDPSAQRRPS